LKRISANEEEAEYLAGKICVFQAQKVGSALDIEQKKRNFTRVRLKNVRSLDFLRGIRPAEDIAQLQKE
jgi:hypothetical protein